MKKPEGFRKTESYRPHTEKEKLLIRSLLQAKNDEDMGNLLRDLLTSAEMEEFANRIEIAKLLLKDESYMAIAKKTKVSTTTVTRVAHWLFRGCGGYWNVLKKIL